ncbi:MAG TPA: DUF4412 domain-containing protein [Chthoniobacteraceae bacterium]|nr:DUF4412 domain-containing protein [Chthoniobacteraceae bacterium]
MKTSLLALGLSLLSSVALWADLVIVQQMDGAGQSGPMTLKIKGDKIRTDMTPQISTIFDAATGVIQTIMHDQKMYMEINAEASQQLLKSMKTQAGAEETKSAPILVATGRKEKIGGYDTELYTLTSGNYKSSYWIAKDYPNSSQLMEVFRKMQSSALSKAAQSMVPQPEGDLPGVPVKVEVEIGPNQKMTTTLISVEEKSLDDNEFVVPEGYKAMAMPSFGTP